MNNITKSNWRKRARSFRPRRIKTRGNNGWGPPRGISLCGKGWEEEGANATQCIRQVEDLTRNTNIVRVRPCRAT